MHKIAFVLCAVLMCSFTSTNQKITSKPYGFSIEIPKDYTFQKDFGEMVPVMIYTPLEGDADDFRENINVTSEKFDGDADTYYQANVMGMNNVLKDFKPLENGRKEVNGQPTHWMIYSFTYGEKTIKVLAYCYSFNARGYVVTCSSSPDSFDRYKDAFMKVAETFKKE